MFGKDNGIEFRIKCSDQNVFEGSTKKNMQTFLLGFSGGKYNYYLHWQIKKRGERLSKILNKI